MQITTEGTQSFLLEADTTGVPAGFLNQLGTTLQTMIANGTVFVEGQSLQVGWMSTRIVTVGGHLTLHEPDMTTFPVRYRPGITETLRHQMLQLYSLDSFALRQSAHAASIAQRAIVCTGDVASSVFMSRSEAAHPSLSGWFFGCLDDNHDHQNAANLRNVSLYEAFLEIPSSVYFLMFPPETEIFFDPARGVMMFYQKEPRKLQPDSLLAGWHQEGKIHYLGELAGS